MKKLLSIILTVVMLLQTAAFAVPQVVTVSDNTEFSEVDIKEEIAEIQAEQWFWPGRSTEWTTYNNHRGIDILDPMNTDVKASKSGVAYIINNTCNGKHSTDGYYTRLTCTISGCKSDTGKCVWIAHGDGSASCYMHLNSISVTNGVAVKQGDVIGKSGTTGPSTGPHLHFEIGYNNSNPKNYWSYTVRGSDNIAYSHTKYTTYVYSLVNVDYANISNGNYTLSNNEFYLNMAKTTESLDALNASQSAANKTFTITKDGDFYMIFATSGTLLNVWCDNYSTNGSQVSLYHDTEGDAIEGAGYRSQRWYFEECNEGYLIHPGDNTSLSLTRDTSTNKLYVNTTTKASNQIWKLENVNQRNVTFNANGGNVSLANKSVISGEKYGDLPTPTRTGYTFNGWYTATSGGTKITSDTTVDLSANQTLYAQWSEKKVNSITVTPTTVELLAGNTYTLSAEVAPVDALNKTLTYISGNTSVATVNSSGVITAVKEGNATITVKAASGVTSTITVIVYANDGSTFSSWVSTLPSNVTDNGYIIEEKNVYRYRDNTVTTEYGDWGAEQTTTTKPTESETLRITSEKISAYNYFHYCMNYYDGDNWVDSIPYGSGQHLYHTKQTTSKLGLANDADKGGKTMYYGSACSYGFTGWFETTPTYTYTYQTRTTNEVTKLGTWSAWQDTKPATATNREIESIKNYRYKLKSYTINYNPNSGTGALANQTKVHGTSLTLSTTKPTRTGYTFLGWSTTQNGSVEYTAGATYTANSAVTLYAVWRANLPSAPILELGRTSYYAHETITCTWEAVTYGDYYEVFVVDNTAEERVIENWGISDTKYTFSLSTAGSYRIYVNAINNDLINTGDVYYTESAARYFSVEKRPEYSVSYNSNGGENAPESQTKTHGTDLILSNEEPSRDGYTFLGWSTTQNGGVEYTAGATYTANSTVTLYAVWQLNAVSVTGVTLNKSTATLKIGETDTLTATVAPSNATNKAVTWKSTNENVAIVSGGVVTAIGEGTATITVTSDDGSKTASCVVTVEKKQTLDAKAFYTIGTASGRAGDTIEIIVSLKTEETFKALGVASITYDENLLKLENVTISNDIKNVTMAQNFDKTNMTFVAVSAEEIAGFEGELFVLTFVIKDDAIAGTYPVSAVVNTTCGSVEIVSVVDAGSVEIYDQLLGDINLDDNVNSDDAIVLLQHVLFPALYPIEYRGSVDFNNDGNVNSDDAIRLLQFVLFPSLYPIN